MAALLEACLDMARQVLGQLDVQAVGSGKCSGAPKGVRPIGKCVSIEDGLVEHSVLVGANGDQEYFHGSHTFMVQPLNSLGKEALGRSAEY